MHVHGALHDRIWRAGEHEIGDSVYHLVAFDAEQRGAEEAFALRIDEHFHEALRLAPLDRAPDASHRHRADERFAPRLAHFAFAHADAAERRVGEKRVNRY